MLSADCRPVVHYSDHPIPGIVQGMTSVVFGEALALYPLT